MSGVDFYFLIPVRFFVPARGVAFFVDLIATFFADLSPAALARFFAFARFVVFSADFLATFLADLLAVATLFRAPDFTSPRVLRCSTIPCAAAVTSPMRFVA